MLDLGFLLANCDGKTPWEELTSLSYKPDREALQGVLKGYSQHQQLSTAELDYLPDAIRFRFLVFGACRFATAIAHHEHADFSQWWWQRYTLAEEIAQQTRMYIEHVAL